MIIIDLIITWWRYVLQVKPAKLQGKNLDIQANLTNK